MSIDLDSFKALKIKCPKCGNHWEIIVLDYTTIDDIEDKLCPDCHYELSEFEKE